MSISPIITAGLLVAAACEGHKYGKPILYVLAALSWLAPMIHIR